MTLMRRLNQLTAILMVVVLLTACATSRMIDSEVQSYAGNTPAVTPASYRFERLPSQVHNDLQNQLELAAQAALGRSGLTRTEKAVRYTVQVAVRVEQYNRYPYYSNRQSGWMGTYPGMLWNYSPLLNLEPPWYKHTVHILLRDVASGQVAYESMAAHDGPWSDTLNLLTPLLDAALRDYPAAGNRKITVELPNATRASK